MIGDIILAIKEWWKQEVTCVHDYHYYEIGIERRNVRICSKCHKLEFA